MAVYPVGPAQTYATVQDAADQLSADVGGADFTEEQEIRIYDDTYTEAVALNAGLRPTSDFRLKLNAASGNDSVVLTNSGLASSTLDLNLVDNVRLAGLEIRGVLAGANYALRDIGANTVIKYCTFDGQGTATYGILGGSAARFVECTFTDCIGALVRQAYESEFVQCVFRDGKVETLYGTAQFEACDFNGAYIRYYSTLVTAPPPGALLRVEGCTFYNAVNAFQFSGTAGYVGTRIRVRNCVFHTITTVFNGPTSSLHRIVSDRNCFYNWTHLAQIDGTDYDSLAAWQAYTDEEGESPDANSIEADPLFANAGSDDFNLQPTSPALHAGQGSGVVKYLDGTPAHLFHPNIGACRGSLGLGEVFDAAEGALLAFVEFDGFLYAFSGGSGYQITAYRSATGDPGSWVQVWQDTGSDYTVGWVIVFNDYIYIGVYGSGTAKVMRSNNGTNWAVVHTFTGYDYTFGACLDGAYLYAGAYAGNPTYTSKAWRTTDGTTWDERTGGAKALRAMTSWGGYIYSTINDWLVRSNDGAGSWVQVHSLGGANAVQAFAVFDGRLYAACLHNGIIFSSDDGASWVEEFNLGYDFNFYGLENVSDSLAAVLYTSPNLGQVYASVDGSTWKKIDEIDTGELGFICSYKYRGHVYTGAYGAGKVRRFLKTSVKPTVTDIRPMALIPANALK